MYSNRYKRNNSGMSAAGLLFLCVIIGGAAFAWFKYLGPFFLNQKIDLANHKFEFNKFEEAKEMYQNLIPKVPEEQKQVLEDRIAQLKLAEEHLTDIAPYNNKIPFAALDVLSAKMGLLYIRLRMVNKSEKPIPVRASLFYLKSAKGKCEVALDRIQNTEVQVPNTTLKPGQEALGGICVKYLLTGDEELYLVYNNGSLYLNSKIMPSRIFAQTDRDEFDKKPDWKGVIKKGSSQGKKKVK